jgi:hypothetical protein
MNLSIIFLVILRTINLTIAMVILPGYTASYYINYKYLLYWTIEIVIWLNLEYQYALPRG